MRLPIQRSRSGFTLVEILIVVAIIGLLASMAVPNFVHARVGSQATACINNLAQIDGAKEQWALEFDKKPDDPVTGNDIRPYLGRGSLGTGPWCPISGSRTEFAGYSLNPVGQLPTCRNYNAQTHDATLK